MALKFLPDEIGPLPFNAAWHGVSRRNSMRQMVLTDAAKETHAFYTSFYQPTARPRFRNIAPGIGWQVCLGYHAGRPVRP
jgi:hypothetical protein